MRRLAFKTKRPSLWTRHVYDTLLEITQMHQFHRHLNTTITKEEKESTLLCLDIDCQATERERRDNRPQKTDDDGPQTQKQQTNLPLKELRAYPVPSSRQTVQHTGSMESRAIYVAQVICGQ